MSVEAGKRASNVVAEASDAKRTRVAENTTTTNNADEQAFEMLEQLMGKLREFADEIKPIDTKILKEQIACTRKHWDELNKVYKARNAVIEAEGGLWGHLITSDSRMISEGLVSPLEINFLREHLKGVEVEDFQDENGSYEVTLTFKETAKDLVEPLVWRKKVVLGDDCETVVEDKCEVTDIKFLTDGLNPIKAVEELRKSAMEDCKDVLEDDAELPIYSVAGWFANAKQSVAGDFGEVLRKCIYPTPEAVMEAIMENEIGSSDEEDDADDDEENEQQPQEEQTTETTAA